MGGVARHQFQAVRDGDGGDHRIAAADGPADTFEVAVDLTCQLTFGLAERQNLFAADVGKEFQDAADALISLETGNDFHDGDRGERIASDRPAVGGGVAGDGRIDAFKNLGQDVGVE